MLPFVSRLLDLIYPAYCELCEVPLSHGNSLCQRCYLDLPLIEPPFCDSCGECYDGQISSQLICPNCSQMTLHFEFARAALHSKDGARQLIHDFKYLHKIHLADELGRLAELALQDARFTPYRQDGILVPVPLFWKRQRQRQFNQSEQIAKHLGIRSGIPMHNILRRFRNTETQTHFSRSKRLQNLKGVFTLPAKHLAHLNNRPVILIDDVFTTGATANECARVLLDSGASRVAILTVLRG